MQLNVDDQAPHNFDDAVKRPDIHSHKSSIQPDNADYLNGPFHNDDTSHVVGPSNILEARSIEKSCLFAVVSSKNEEDVPSWKKKEKGKGKGTHLIIIEAILDFSKDNTGKPSHVQCD